ncbi:MAG: TSCPD domain-containing protein [Clostridia bacterium]|nr:TSCPD domain-containing protein [Clostridia bacterium]
MIGFDLLKNCGGKNTSCPSQLAQALQVHL